MHDNSKIVSGFRYPDAQHDIFKKTSSLSKNISDNILEVERLSFHYPRTKNNILNNISFKIKSQTLCGLLGPNGSGKSTLFRCCMNFLHSQEGHIRVQNEDLQNLTPAKLAKYIAYVPQEHKQPFPFLVEDMVLMGRTSCMKSSISPKKEDLKKVQICMEKVGISHLHHKAFNQLSGGQRQLVLIARALAQESPLMLLDEPSSALDFNNQILVWKLLQELVNDGITILVCSHDPNHILWFCTDALILSEGKVLAQGHPHELLKAGTFSQIYGTDIQTLNINNTFMIYPNILN